MTTASQQSTAVSQLLSDFYKGRSLAILDQGTDPQFSDYANTVEYDELVRRAAQDYTGSADPATAAAVEQAHEAIAALREYEMSTRTRLDLYANMASEYSSEGEYHADRAKFMTSLLDSSTRVPYLE